MSKKTVFVILSAVVLVAAVFVGALWLLGLFPAREYYGEDFGIERVYSSVDYNENGVDDYTDILYGARKDAQNHPKYDGSYVVGGYPSDDVGVCTDVVWRAFKNAGYSLKDMVDADIAKRQADYTNVQTPDPDIDFRRVKNLRVFFEGCATRLTDDINDVSEWQAGDIVIFGNDKHIGIVSDKRNSKGQPYIIHNGGQPKREEDFFSRLDVIGGYEVTGHYRFDASKLDKSFLCPWVE